MSVTLSGVLSIKSVQGTRGAFSVGDLSTEVGNFRIKDALLDEFDPGQYHGRFVIGHIFPSSYTWRGKVSVEIRAKLLEILLDETPAPMPSSSSTSVEHEPDPIDEPPQSVEHAPERIATRTPAPVGAAPLANAAAPETLPADVSAGRGDVLFDEALQAIIDAGGPVKLDPTIDRELFRKQRDALKAMGFRFDATAQHWIST